MSIDAGPPADRARRAAADATYGAVLDEVAEVLRGQARSWAGQLRLVHGLDTLAPRTSFRSGQFAALEMAGSWSVGQLTATRWQWEAERFHDALPRTLARLETGALLVHQASVLLHRTRSCTAEVAREVETRVLPEAAELSPADLTRLVDRVVLQIESEQAEAGAAEQRHADAAAQRRTFIKATQDGMGLAGAVLTAEQLLGWRTGLDALERRERVADRTTGVERTAEQRRADLFAALPALVLAGTAQDRAAAGAAVPAPALTCPTGTAADAAAGTTSEHPTTGHPTTGHPTTGHPTPQHPTPGHPTPEHPAAEGRPAGPVALRPWTLGPEQVAAQVVVNVLVPVATVLELSRAPGTVEGYGPVSAEHVRLLRPHSWRRVLIDADSGRPIFVDDHRTPTADDPHTARQQVLAMLRPEVVTDVDEPQHDPSARLARLIRLRDVHCCGPGCMSTRTHNDHLEPYPHGPTSAANLGRLSPRCHRAKHHGWLLVRHPDGSATWTSPIGRTYHRPSPHPQPPHIDLDSPPPPVRPRPAAQPPARHDPPPDPAPACAHTDDPADTDTATAPGDEVNDDADDDPPPF